MCGGKQYVENVCMYAAQFRLFCGTNTQTVHHRACRKRQEGSVLQGRDKMVVVLRPLASPIPLHRIVGHPNPSRTCLAEGTPVMLLVEIMVLLLLLKPPRLINGRLQIPICCIHKKN